ncbi:MAG TPA: ATP-binding protein [Holophagaceae bacterium]|nr:ATP-binding protein [Holophagaceae bacterium]
MIPLFLKAEEVVSGYFATMANRPEEGHLEIGGQRYLLVRAGSLSVEFFDLVAELYGMGREEEADAFARNLLFDLAHAMGRSDAKAFHAQLGLTDPVAKLSAGPVHFAHAGWALVDIHSDSKPSPDEDFFLHYDHPASFEAQAWQDSGRTRLRPACIMNSGYSSGWCQESFGLPLVATELLCRAKGDPCCRFIMAPPSRMEARLQAYQGLAGAPAPTGIEIPDFFSRKRLEEELRRSKDELEHRVEERTRELAVAHERMRKTQKLEALGRLAGGVSHDFNNLLTAMLGYAELAQGQFVDGGSPEASLAQLKATALRAAGLTRQLLAFSRRQVLRTEVLDLSSVVLGMAEMLRPVLGEQVTLELELDPGAGFLEADPAQLEQVILNLALNARDAMARDGILHLATRRVRLEGQSWVELEVRDNGQGMDEEVLSHLYEPFFTTKPLGEGTGLGLATVYGIVEQSRGQISVESAPGQGTRFFVRFPPAMITQPVDIPLQDLPAPTPSATILVAEDESAVREAVVRILQRAGHTVLQAANPLEALDLVDAHPGTIHLLLTDMVMPHLSGKELAARFRALRPEAIVLYMSGYTEQELGPEESRRFLQKPFTKDGLLAKIAELLG